MLHYGSERYTLTDGQRYRLGFEILLKPGKAERPDAFEQRVADRLESELRSLPAGASGEMMIIFTAGIIAEGRITIQHPPMLAPIVPRTKPRGSRGGKNRLKAQGLEGPSYTSA
ncbi:hypothetical protein [Herpetosiphon geysericola]|uniref:Uncharacterized protein n=1 Tax=Herpetosiphon geysericola TaxID=70996 RepID=A0A0N8GT07_9CHLR|nr:hypothetical protein [Herpetosiphon geysericola]KPL90770.1 hypothetical protein SE18_05230 [Herpetosiphon geysericola]